LISLVLGFGFVALCALMPLAAMLLCYRPLAANRSPQYRANVGHWLRTGAVWGTGVTGVLYTISQFARWHGQGVFGIISLPPIACAGGMLGVIVAGMVVLLRQKMAKDY
jgi:hypothetical protein